MRLDGAIGRGIGHTGQNETGFDLVIVEEALIRLINCSRGDLAGTGRAGSGAAGVGQVDALLFGSIKNVLIVRDLDGRVESFAFGDKGDLVRSHG